MTILCGEISAFMETFFFVYFHKDDIVPNLADTFPGNDIFIITSEQAAESSGAWKYKGGELTAFAVKFRINGTSETAAYAFDNNLCIFAKIYASPFIDTLNRNTV